MLEFPKEPDAPGKKGINLRAIGIYVQSFVELLGEVINNSPLRVRRPFDERMPQGREEER